MVREIRIYFEGDDRLRPGFHSFFADLRAAAWARRIRLQLVAGKGKVVRGFINALAKYPSARYPQYPADGQRWAGQQPTAPAVRTAIRLATTKSGTSVSDGQIHWMVQAMEAWFLADRAALRRYYGQQLRDSVPPWELNPR